ncbi:hypothetical protein OQJ15_02845 [Fluoribacter dumoffii]|uniref:hypothetical protein n=1 Tax=Fluoribacter dumoffii TaxID=463 RepID=UPI0022439296|nr:hypothetical protein [Fluoribacter dumoffii]MCW8385239.1 hypothetical protein [Fluoribacter dumoffii]MCW8496464.1 hypothetical protein [Fluoribacter dumoffii]
MPNQGKIISAVNVCLKQKKNIDFVLNKKGICAALAALHLKYTAENKRDVFFNLLEQLAALPSTYRIGDNHAIDNFIIKIEKTFRADEYSHYEILQCDVEKLLDIGNKPLKNELNLGLITSESNWKELFKKITRNNRSYLVCSHNHAISVSFENGKYIVYDPNYNRRLKEFDGVEELVKEIKDCFDYKEDSFGLVVRAFSHPKAVPENYPSHEELHQIAFSSAPDSQSSFFAAMANDIDMLRLLFKQNKIDYTILAKEYFRSEFNDLLLQQPKSLTLKNAILKGIFVTLLAGNHKEGEKLFEHYLQTFTATEDLSDLKKQLQLFFDEPVQTYGLLMKKEADFSKLLTWCEELNFSQEPKNQTTCNHLQLLTFVTQEVNPYLIEQFLNKLTPEQLIKQIQCAAIVNQHHILNLLLTHLNKNSINPKLFPCIFNKEVVENINAITLKKLLEKGFNVATHDPDLLTLCMQRHDRKICEVYARAWAEQTLHPSLWQHIDTRDYQLIDLNTLLGSSTLLNVLVFLRKYDQVKNAWKDNISEETIKNALVLAILNGNKEMSLFLQGKLIDKKSALEPETLDFLYQKALEEEDLSILSTLVHLNYNVLHNTKDLRKLFLLCSDYEDYSIFEKCFAKASPKIKQLILETSLNRGTTPVLMTCAKQEPQLFSKYLCSSTTAPGNLVKLNRAIPKISPIMLSMEQLNPTEQKKLVKDSFKQKLPFLARTLCPKITWEKEELDEFLNELIQDKNENGIKLLLQLFPVLKQNRKLIPLLAQNNLLIAIDYILEKESVVIDPDLTEQMFICALGSNNKNLVARFLQQERVTPKTQLKESLADLLKQAIEKGNASVLEPFVESTHDFGLDFKELFLFSCTQKQEKIANLLLARAFTLSPNERKDGVKQLFGEQSPSSLFEKVYFHGYGRLYQLLLRANIQNPRASLLDSIKNPEQDHSFQNTELYLSSQLKRALKEKNEAVFNALFAQSDLPAEPSKSILDFLKDPILFDSVFPLLKKKYSLQKLLNEIFKHTDWETLANLLEKTQWENLDPSLHHSVQEHAMVIVKAYLENLKAHYDKIDVRPQLFKLLESKNPYILAQLAIPYREEIQKTLEEIELNMVKNQLDLNNQIYRYTFSILPFMKALEELGKIVEECQRIVSEQDINLDESIENHELINHLAQIKIILAGQDISPDYLQENHYDLLEKLIENPRFKQVCQLEFKLYSLLRQFQKPLSAQSEVIQKEFHTTIGLLNEALAEAKLPRNFVLPDILPFLISAELAEDKRKSQPPSPAITHKDEDYSVPPQTLEGSAVKAPEPEEKYPGQKETTQQNITLPQIFSNSPPKSSERLLTPSDDTPSDLDRLKKKCIKALDYYLIHREEHLSYFSYFFDYYRGQTRAQHYKNLINSAQTEHELNILEFAILINHDGAQLKKDFAEQLQFKDLDTAQDQLMENIQAYFTRNGLIQSDGLFDWNNQLYELINSINEKVNQNDQSATEYLFGEELAGLEKLAKPPSNRESFSFFKPDKQSSISRFLQWITSWFDYGHSSSEEQENVMSL